MSESENNSGRLARMNSEGLKVICSSNDFMSASPGLQSKSVMHVCSYAGIPSLTHQTIKTEMTICLEGTVMRTTAAWLGCSGTASVVVSVSDRWKNDKSASRLEY